MERQIELASLRKSIDKIDKKIIRLVERRMEFSRKIREIKRKNNIPITDKKRENEIIRKISKDSLLDKSFIKRLFFDIFRESKKLQK